MRKKWVVMLLTSLMAVSVVTACGKESETAGTEAVVDTETEMVAPSSPAEEFGDIVSTEDPNAPREDKSSLDGLSGDAVDMDENVGDKDHFAFSYNGKLYEFTADDTTMLYAYKSFMEDTGAYPDQGGIVDLVNDVNGKTSRLMGVNTGDFKDVKSTSQVVYEGDNVTIYLYTDNNRHWDYYYVVFDDFVFQLYDYQMLTANGVKEDAIFEAADQVPLTISEADKDETLSSPDGVITSQKVFDNYRFAFPEVLKPSYTVTYNVDETGTEFDEDRLCVNGSIAMQGTEVYHVLFTLDTEASTDVEGDYQETGAEFAGYKIYFDPDGVTGGICYRVMLGEDPVRITLSSANSEFDENAVADALGLLFTEME
ncbi:MAG: hypothetical protein ACI4DO_08865 [Roseburia sp.]